MKKIYALSRVRSANPRKKRVLHGITKHCIRMLSLFLLVYLSSQTRSFGDCVGCNAGSTWSITASSTEQVTNKKYTDLACPQGSEPTNYFLLYTYTNYDVTFNFTWTVTGSNVNIYIYRNGATTPYAPAITNVSATGTGYTFDFPTGQPGNYVIDVYTNGSEPGNGTPVAEGSIFIQEKITTTNIVAPAICSSFTGTEDYHFQVYTDPPINNIMVKTSHNSPPGNCDEPSETEQWNFDFSQSSSPLTINTGFNLCPNPGLPSCSPYSLYGSVWDPSTNVTDFYISASTLLDYIQNYYDGTPATWPVIALQIGDYNPGNIGLGVQVGSFTTPLTTVQIPIVDLNSVSSLPTFSPLTINDVDVNTLCAPNKVPGLNATLTTSVSGGLPPYSYTWSPVTGNQTTLSNNHIASPTIASVTSGVASPIADYTLTVTDATTSCVSGDNVSNQSASREVKMTMITDATKYDLASRDSYYDMLDEPNSQPTINNDQWNIWLSQDVWNRHAEDGSTQLQDPEYDLGYDYNSTLYDIPLANYVYTLVRNVGCAASPTTVTKADGTSTTPAVNLYWTMGAGGEGWPASWDGTGQYTNSSGIPLPEGGQIISIPISTSIPAGQSMTFGSSWYPPDPTRYYGSSIPSMELCFLTRILDYHDATSGNPVGMTIPEVTPVDQDVPNNNNIVTHNSTVTTVTPGNGMRIAHLLIGNIDEFEQPFNLVFANEAFFHSGSVSNLYKYVTVTISLDSTVWNRWIASGAAGTYRAIDYTNKTVTFDGTHLVELDNIDFLPNEQHPMQLAFAMLPGASGDSMKPETVHFIQTTGGPTRGDTLSSIYGGFTFFVKYAPPGPPKPKGVLAVTEMSNGPSGDCEYGELIVANCGTDTAGRVDVRGWIIDDNSGNFDTAGCTSSVGVAQGHYRLAYDSSVWGAVPVGSIIAMYNHDDNCYNLPDTFTIDTTATGLVYWIPIGGTADAPYGSPHVERYAPAPVYSDCAYCGDSTTTYTVASAWESTIGLNNTADALQVRCPGCTVNNPGVPAFYQGVGYGSLTGADAFAAIPANTFEVGGPVISGAGTGKKYVFEGASAADFDNTAEWTKANADAAGVAPATLGVVPAGLMSAVTTHSLNLPCCRTMNTNAMRKAIPAIAAQNIKVYPNPATGMVNFQFTQAASTEITLMDISGRTMAKQTVINGSAASFNVADYASGIYLYQAIADGRKQYGKIVVGK